MAKKPPLKHPSAIAGKPVPGASRLWDGWQAGALVLLLASSAVFLAVPRAVEPVELPLPRIDQPALAATMAGDDALARKAEEATLDVDIRAVGRELRAYNRVVAAGEHDALYAARLRVVRATARALGLSEEALLTLRAYQTVRFVSELRRWQQTGQVTDELEQLGGDFLRLAQRNRWCAGLDRELIPDERVLRAFYKKRWNDVTGANAGLFALTLDEDRVRLGFFLQHPLTTTAPPEGRSPLAQRRWQAANDRQRLQVIARLGQRDPSYPGQLARGVLLYQSQKFGAATEAFRRHLEAAPDGPHTLRAQNYLKAALDQNQAGLF